MSNQVLAHEVSNDSLNPHIDPNDPNRLAPSFNDPLNPQQTSINIKDNNATIVLPAGYDPSNITIVKAEEPSLPLPPRQEPQTVVDLLEDDSL